ncbi:hypothetical protein [Pedobacter aquatilis]|uniref:YobI family P-loop NTPase n=1 Tax=Pedobacter aquatilis TaxID=351343 RepID=UPI00292DAF5E|nr:hypothetical protein [Pedobacter aquatilis]
MNKTTLKIARYLQIWLYKKIKQSQAKSTSINDQENPNYHSLSPIGDANVDKYIEALQWAIDNSKEKDIYNIALTGPYGSGKSSILKTFKNIYSHQKDTFLDISLATFKEELSEEENTNTQSAGEKKTKSNDEILRLIELSILQQIFYHEEDSKIPDSRFKKIKSFNRKSLYYITSGLILAIIFGLNIFYTEEFNKQLRLNLTSIGESILHWTSLIGFIVASTVALYRSVKVLYSLRISKITIQQTEIEIDKNISKSILNNHIDEILYFFEVTPYSIVLIEDLDRFRQAEIFTKLRELNLLINNSKKLKHKHVIFIYAVRDEMFQNKDRTKFFDFIIPVIPVINSSNSKDKLSSIIQNQHSGITDDLIDEISLFVDDMRLLYNINNEYAIYSGILDKALNRGKLLAILVYKNIYPDDFVLLANNEGMLYSLLNKRAEFIKAQATHLDQQIKENKKEIERLGETMLKSSDELRQLYTSKYASQTQNFGKFRFKDTDYSIIEAASEEGFEYFSSGEFNYITYIFYNYNQWTRTEVTENLDFEEFQYLLDPDQSYQERLALIEEKFEGKQEMLKKENATYEREKISNRSLKLKEILSKTENQHLSDTSTKQGQLLGLLLRNGYIDEEYLDYISLFYEGSLTKQDRAFILNVKNQTESDHETKLTKIENIIKKLRATEFREVYILNYNLVDYLLENKKHENYLINLMSQFSKLTDQTFRFIDSFMAIGAYTIEFMRRLVHQTPDLWLQLNHRDELTTESKAIYFKEILSAADVEDLKLPDIIKHYRKEILSNKTFLNFLEDKEKIAKIITELEIIFTDIEIKGASMDLIHLIIDESHYEINNTMLKRILQQEDQFQLPRYERQNYSAILSSKDERLKSRIELDINKYIENIYLTQTANNIEQENELIKLYNNSKISLGNRINIIQKTTTKISNLSAIKQQELDSNFFSDQKIEHKWENLIEYFHRHAVLDNPIVDYLNNKETAEGLSKLKINISTPYIDKDTTKRFILQLINTEDISNNFYEQYIKQIPYDYSIENLHVNEEKMRILIALTILEPKPENFIKLKIDYSGLQYDFLDVFSGDALSEADAYELDIEDVGHIFESKAINESLKISALQSVNSSIITGSHKALITIKNLMFSLHPLQISKEIMIAVLQQNFRVEERVKLFNMYYKNFDSHDTTSIFKNFPTPYNKIGEKHTSPIVEDTIENQFLANNLKENNMISNSKPYKKGIKIINFKWK